MTTLTGVFAPLITPFKDGAIDLTSYRRLIDHFLAAGVSGFVPLGTTGEAPALDDDEIDTLVAETVEAVAGRAPVFVGIGGNATHKVIRAVKRLSRHGFTGILSVCPYYNRPTQDGLRQHFTAIAESTDRPILIYNIPYRTSVNLSNDTLLRLAELPNIVGVKDSSGNMAQSLELLANRPKGFSVLTGEDELFLSNLSHGGDGGILASCHLATDAFVDVFRLHTANDHRGARAQWAPLMRMIPALFKEANPIPLKYCLWRQGLIASPECRLPLTSVSQGLAGELDRLLEQLPSPLRQTAAA